MFAQNPERFTLGYEKIALASATKSCELDPLPTPLVKHHIDALSHLLARTINASLSSTVFPAPMKHAVVVPSLKKGGSDASMLTNYRPISNITFVAKITERFVAQHPHVDKSPCFSSISSYKSSYIIPFDAHKVYYEYQYSTSFAAY